MFGCCQTPLCIFILLCMFPIHNSYPVGHRGALSFSNSLHLTRTIRSRVQQLLSLYKQQLFDDELFEYREMMLSSLPAVTVSYRTWLHMEDIERLRVASQYLQIFWTHLEGQRQQLVNERDITTRRQQRRDKRGRRQPTLSQSFEILKIDLRDLMSQVNNQLNSISRVAASTKSQLLDSMPSSSTSSLIPSMHHSSESTTSTTAYTFNPGSSALSSTESPQILSPSDSGSTSATEGTSVSLPQPNRTSKVSYSNQQTTTVGKSRWTQFLNGYVVLRDLERYLSRLARDYTLLQAKY